MLTHHECEGLLALVDGEIGLHVDAEQKLDSAPDAYLSLFDGRSIVTPMFVTLITSFDFQA